MNWRDHLSEDEIERMLAISDVRSWATILLDWAIVFASFALVAAWPNPLTVVVALCLIGARQLGLAVCMHEAAHRTLFRSIALNDWAGNWLCAYPIWSDVHPYRGYHLKHHQKTWTKEDPDLGLATPFPITRQSLWRKVGRDLSGRTGWKRAGATWRRDMGLSQGRARRLDFTGTRNLAGVAVTNAILLATLTLAGHPTLYLLWVGAWLTTYSLVMRIRSIAEHSMPGDPVSSPLQNTRTTEARWWERLFIAPNRVNYHLEHHLATAVPHYRLPELHRLLRERGVLDGANVAHGYLEVLQHASSRT
jgi:fatty acid desaturase